MPNEITTWLDTRYIKKLEMGTPDNMFPSDNPYLAIVEGYLTAEQCKAIIEAPKDKGHYKFPGCGATTYEYPRPLPQELFPVSWGAEKINELYWCFDLAAPDTAWLQKYYAGSSYQKHVDTTPGQSRKLTAIALLSDPSDYQGGDLTFYMPNESKQMPKTMGTVIVFPSWMWHGVDKINSGLRYSLNIGFYGPPFK